jgi:hypothetical protein
MAASISSTAVGAVIASYAVDFAAQFEKGAVSRKTADPKAGG